MKYHNVLLRRAHGEKSWTLDGLNVYNSDPSNYPDGDWDRMIYPLSERESKRLEKYDPNSNPIGVVETKKGLRFFLF